MSSTQQQQQQQQPYQQHPMQLNAFNGNAVAINDNVNANMSGLPNHGLSFEIPAHLNAMLPSNTMQQPPPPPSTASSSSQHQYYDHRGQLMQSPISSQQAQLLTSQQQQPQQQQRQLIYGTSSSSNAIGGASGIESQSSSSTATTIRQNQQQPSGFSQSVLPPVPSIPLDYALQSELLSLRTDSKLELNESTMEKYANDEKLKSDYDEACSMNIVDDIQLMHMLYSLLPSDVKDPYDNHLAIMLVHLAYMNKYADLVKRHSCLIDYIFVLCCLLVRATVNTNIMKSLKMDNVSASSVFNKFLFKKNGTFKLPSSMRRTMDEYRNQKTPYDATLRKRTVRRTQSSTDTTHPLQSLSYMRNALSLGDYMKCCVPLDFVPLFCVARLADVPRYKPGGVGIDRIESGVVIDSRKRIFIILMNTQIQEYTYLNIDEQYSGVFLKFLKELLPGKRIDRFQANRKKKMICTNLSSLNEEPFVESSVSFMLTERISLFRTMSHNVYTEALSTQTFPSHMFQIPSDKYNEIKSTEADEPNVDHCVVLQQRYNITFDENNDDDDDDDSNNNNSNGTATDAPVAATALVTDVAVVQCVNHEN